MKLFDYFRSTASYRVRIALRLKGIDFETQEVHLVNHGGEQNAPEYLKLNPQGLVPTLEDNGQVLTQSLAIIEYLDELYPAPSLLPKSPYEKAVVRSLAFTIACDIHPLNNLRVLQQLKKQFEASEEQVKAWYHLWLRRGFDALESRLETMKRTKPVCFGNDITLADICLIPQVYNAIRFEFPLEGYPLIQQINKYCLELPAFKDSAP